MGYVPQVIEKHYSLYLGVRGEKAAVVAAVNSTDEEDLSNEDRDPTVVMYWSLSVAIFSIGGMLSSFLVGFIADLRGR